MGMNARKRIYLDINPADRARLLASATAYAAGRRTYVVGAVSDVVAANAGRLDAAVRETLADAIRPAADAGDSIDAPAWTRALEPDGAEFGWPGDFAYALLMPAEIMRVMFASDLDVPEMARGFGAPWCQVRRRLAMLGLDDYCE